MLLRIALLALCHRFVAAGDALAPVPSVEYRMLALTGDPSGTEVVLNTAVAGPNTATNRFLCIHGFPDHSYAWIYFLLEPLSRQFGGDVQMVAPDMRGTNRSEPKLPDADFYKIDRLAGDINHLWAQHFAGNGTAGFWLLAHDWGAAVSWSYAGTVPNPEMKGFVPMAIPFLAAGQILSGSQAAASSYRAMYAQPASTYYALKRVNFLSWHDMFLEIPYERRRPLRELYQDAWAFEDSLLYHFLWYTANEAGRGIFTQTPTVPTLLIWGSGDGANSDMTLCCQMYFLPNMSMAVLNSSHWIFQQNPDLVAEIVAEFVAQNSQPPVPPPPSSPLQPLIAYCAAHPEKWTAFAQQECRRVLHVDPPYNLLGPNKSTHDLEMDLLVAEAEACTMESGCPPIVPHLQCLSDQWFNYTCVKTFCDLDIELHQCLAAPDTPESCSSFKDITLLGMANMIYCHLADTELQDIDMWSEAFAEDYVAGVVETDIETKSSWYNNKRWLVVYGIAVPVAVFAFWRFWGFGGSSVDHDYEEGDLSEEE